VPIIRTEGLTKRFGKTEALSGVDLEVKEGEIYGFIGPNGAGKSTTIRILLGLIRATSGQARVFGLDAWKDAVRIRRRLAYVPGDVTLWPNLTGGEAVDLLLGMRGAVRPGKREQLIERFRFDPSKKCGTYSKGNRQKAALIAAFAADAGLLVRDDPAAGLDPRTELEFQACVREAKREGRTVLLSSHILSEVEKLCDSVGIIRNGRIIESGSLAELRHLTRTHLRVETREPPGGLKEMKGVHDFAVDGNAASFQVDAEELENVVAALARLGVVRLESAPPTLEDLFMRHYELAGAGGVR